MLCPYEKKAKRRPLLSDVKSARISESSCGVLHRFVPCFAPFVKIGVGCVSEELSRSVVENVRALALGDQRAIGSPHTGTEIKTNGALSGFCVTCVFAAGN
jgi:hypothetical protein